MKYVLTSFFKEQLNELGKKYIHAEEDFLDFQRDFVEGMGTHLGEGVYKVRRKNNSIPTGKRGGFRFIVKVWGKYIVPILVYAKSQTPNVTKKEINLALKSIDAELGN